MTQFQLDTGPKNLLDDHEASETQPQILPLLVRKQDGCLEDPPPLARAVQCRDDFFVSLPRIVSPSMEQHCPANGLENSTSSMVEFDNNCHNPFVAVEQAVRQILSLPDDKNPAEEWQHLVKLMRAIVGDDTEEGRKFRWAFVMKCGITVDYITATMNRYFDKDIQVLGCLLLVRLVLYVDTALPTKAGAISAVVTAMMTHRQALPALRILHRWSRRFELHKQMIEEGAAPVIHLAMKLRFDMVDLQENGVEFFSNLLANPNCHKRSVVLDTAIRAANEACWAFANNEAIKAALCDFLLKLELNSYIREIIVQTGGIESLVTKAIAAHPCVTNKAVGKPQRIQVSALRVLLGLANHEMATLNQSSTACLVDALVKNDLVGTTVAHRAATAGLTPLVLESMKQYPSDPQLLEAGAGLLVHLCKCRRRKEIIEYDGISILMKIQEQGIDTASGNLQLFTLEAIRKLVCSYLVACFPSMAPKEAIDGVLKVVPISLQRGDDRGIVVGCKVLAGWIGSSSNSNPGAVGQTEKRDYILQKGGMDLVRAIMTTFPTKLHILHAAELLLKRLSMGRGAASPGTGTGTGSTQGIKRKLADFHQDGSI